MIFIDANVFLRHLAAPATPEDEVLADAAANLFTLVERGGATATTSEATIAEVIFIITDKRHYGAPRPLAASALKTLLGFRNFRLHNKAVCMRALDIWETHARLSFPDSLAAAYSEITEAVLATFDERLTRVETVRLHNW